MRLRASEMAAATGGTLCGPDVWADGVTIDSREVTGGELFVPLVADRDGHDYIAEALARRAACYLTARAAGPGTAVRVTDTGQALTALGAQARARLPGRTAAITGSVGKTTTKDLARAVLSRRYRTAASRNSHNNELGVPLSLLNAPAGSKAVVLELGTGAPGEIAGLCRIARPTAGIVTRVAPAHIASLGDLDAVARAKAELIEALPATGLAILNADDRRVAAMASLCAAPVVRFGTGRGADVRAEAVEIGFDLRPRFRLRTPWGTVTVRVAARGAHQVTNALAAGALGLAWGVPLEDVARALDEAEITPRRMALERTPEGALVLDDSWNASPAATAAALRALAAVPARHRIAILGPMAELGRASRRHHRRVGLLARVLGIQLIAVGTPDFGAEPAASLDQALERLGRPGDGTAILVKGSRCARMERAVEALLHRADGSGRAERDERSPDMQPSGRTPHDAAPTLTSG